MKSFPLFVGMQGARVVIVGGGEPAAQKYRLLGRTPAAIDVMAPELTGELARLAQAGRIGHIARTLEPAAFAGARLVVVATGCAALDAVAADLARAAGALVNVVDRPALSDVTMPSIVDRAPVVVAIGTEGTAPVLGRQIKTRIEEMLEPSLGAFAAMLGRLRPRVAYRIASADRRRFWEWVMAVPRRLSAAGDRHGALGAIEEVLSSGEVPDRAAGRVSLVSPGSGAADLMTLRAVERLQSADIVMHDADCPQGILELARRDAARQIVGPADGPEAWRLERGAQIAGAAAAAGAQVVWLIDAVDPAAARIGDLAEIVPSARAEPASAVIARAEDR